MATGKRFDEQYTKPFLSNKGVLAGTDISLIKDEKIVTDDHDLCEIFNDYCCEAAIYSCAAASLGEIDSRCLYVFLPVFNNFAVTSVSGY